MSPSVPVAVIKKQGVGEYQSQYQSRWLNALDGSYRKSVLQILLFSEEIKRKSGANPNLLVSDSNVKTIACSSHPRENRLVGATGRSPLLKFYALRGNLWGNHIGLLPAAVTPSKEDDHPHEAK